MSEPISVPQDLLGWLKQIELRPEMYLGCRDLRALRHLITGYEIAKLEHGIKEDEWLSNDFCVWLAKRYQDSRNIDWCDLILCNEVLYENPQRALSRFYELLHLYLEETHGTE